MKEMSRNCPTQKGNPIEEHTQKFLRSDGRGSQCLEAERRWDQWKVYQSAWKPKSSDPRASKQRTSNQMKADQNA
jgi:hypothetical protein